MVMTLQLVARGVRWRLIAIIGRKAKQDPSLTELKKALNNHLITSYFEW